MSRNEAARSRRRQQLKQDLSLRSIPLPELPAQKYNLDNHFGWNVLQKCRIGDGAFPPYLLHCIYCDKPEVPGRGDDNDKIMYVLYIQGKDGDLGGLDVKETQTGLSNTTICQILQSAPPAEPLVKGKRKKSSLGDKRKVISCFYYIPIQERLNSNTGDDLMMGKVPGGKKGSKGRSKPKSWQLRAGAEIPDREGDDESTDTSDTEGEEEKDEQEEKELETMKTRETREQEKNEKEEETMKKFLENFKKDCTDCFCKPNDNEQLMESPSEKNKFLYLRRERYDKRLHASD